MDITIFELESELKRMRISQSELKKIEKLAEIKQLQIRHNRVLGGKKAYITRRINSGVSNNEMIKLIKERKLLDTKTIDISNINNKINKELKLDFDIYIKDNFKNVTKVSYSKLLSNTGYYIKKTIKKYISGISNAIEKSKILNQPKKTMVLEKLKDMAIINFSVYNKFYNGNIDAEESYTIIEEESDTYPIRVDIVGDHIYIGV